VVAGLATTVHIPSWWAWPYAGCRSKPLATSRTAQLGEEDVVVTSDCALFTLGSLAGRARPSSCGAAVTIYRLAVGVGGARALYTYGEWRSGVRLIATAEFSTRLGLSAGGPLGHQVGRAVLLRTVSGRAGVRPVVGFPVSHQTPCHPIPQKQIGTAAQLREPARTPLLHFRPVTPSPGKPPEGAKREKRGENAVDFLWGSRATGALLSS